MTERLDKRILSNGMVLLAEPMAEVESAAFGFMLPAGAATLPEGCCGAGNVITDWVFRGAGDLNSRQLSDALDGLGLHRSSSTNSSHLTVGAALEAAKLTEALALYADILLRPALPEKQFDLARLLALDGVRSMDDNPRQKVMIQLREHFYRAPLGRSTVGRIDELESLTSDCIREVIREKFSMPQTILAVAGKYDFNSLAEQVEGLFGTAEDRRPKTPALGGKGEPYVHIPNEGSQVHIGLMTPTVAPGDERYYDARVAISILSGGMSARLFTEVREKRGLCYAIGARYHSLKNAAGIMCYAGTTPDKAQETLDVVAEQFRGLGDGITEEELQRAKAGLKSNLILQSESSSSRAAGVGRDYYVLGRVRTLDEIKQAIEKVTVESVTAFVGENAFEDFTVVTVGPKPVQMKLS